MRHRISDGHKFEIFRLEAQQNDSKLFEAESSVSQK
jgi:hypothetical protein